MIIRDQKLRKVSNSVFQEAKLSEDRSRPLEWRRNFNQINLPLKNIKIVNTCNIHDVDFDFKNSNATPLNLVKTDISDQIAIKGIVDEDQIGDRLYFAIEEGEDNIFSIERSPGNIIVSIKVGKPTKEDTSEDVERVPPGLYYGLAFRTNFKPEEDDMFLDLTAPKEQLLSLISALRADTNSTLNVVAKLLSFTYEVDDALREPSYPQDIIIIDANPCFLAWANVTSKIGRHYLISESQYDDGDEEEVENLYQEESTPEKRLHEELLKVAQSSTKSLNGLVKAIWVLIIVIAMYVFLNWL